MGDSVLRLHTCICLDEVYFDSGKINFDKIIFSLCFICQFLVFFTQNTKSTGNFAQFTDFFFYFLFLPLIYLFENVNSVIWKQLFKKS